MKYFKLPIFIATLFLFISCNSDDSEDILVESASIVDTWNLVAIATENGEATITQDGITITVEFSLETTNEDLQITFTENPNIVTSEGSFTQITTVSAFGETETEETFIESTFLNGEWVLNEGTLTIISSENTLDAFTPSFEITRLTDNFLEIQQSLDQAVELDGNTVNASGNLIITFER